MTCFALYIGTALVWKAIGPVIFKPTGDVASQAALIELMAIINQRLKCGGMGGPLPLFIWTSMTSRTTVGPTIGPIGMSDDMVGCLA